MCVDPTREISTGEKGVITVTARPRLLVAWAVVLSLVVLAVALGQPARRRPAAGGQKPAPAQDKQAAAEQGDGQNQPQVVVSVTDQGVSLFCTKANAHEVLGRLAQATGLKLIVNDTVSDRLTLTLRNRTPEEILEAVATAYGLALEKVNGVYMVSSGVPDNPASYLLSDIAAVTAKYVPAYRVKTLMPNFLQDYIKVNPAQNAVVLSAPREVLEKFREDVAQLDIPAQQIMIDVLVVEFTDVSVEELGLNITAQGGTTAIGVDTLLGTITFQGIAKLPRSFESTLNALCREGRARVRARPRIATVSGQRASIFIGTEKFISQPVRRGENSIKAGVRLEVSPYSGAGGVIIVNVGQAEISTLTAPDPVTGLPNKTTRTAETMVRVHDGETIILGGLVQHEVHEIRHAVPILKEIPIIGRLFDRTKKEDVRTEVMIFITPRILTLTGHLPPEEEAETMSRFGVSPEGPLHSEGAKQ